jgi:hypothetical protein
VKISASGRGELVVMADDPSVHSARRKVERANKHIADLDRACFAFFDDYRVSAQHYAEPGTHKVRLVDDISVPDDIALLAGDAIHNLRSALDHLAWQLVLVSGNSPTRQTGFPIFQTPEEYERESGRKVKGMREEIKKAIRLCNPYKGGNDGLWALHELNNFDKHRLLFVVVSAFDRIGFEFVGQPIQWNDMGKARGLKVGDIIFTTFGRIPDQKIHFHFEIAFREPEIVQGKPLTPTLQGMSDLMSNIISDFSPFFA